MIYTISQICSSLSKTILNISIHSRNKTIQFLPSFGNILAVTIPRHLCFRSARARRPNPSLLSPSPNNINSNRSSGALSLVLHLRISPPPLSPPPLFPFPVGSWKKVISSLVFHLDFIPDFILCRYRVTDKSGFVALFLYSCNYRLIFFFFLITIRKGALFCTHFLIHGGLRLQSACQYLLLSPVPFSLGKYRFLCLAYIECNL